MRNATSSKDLTVRNPKTGQLLTVKGAGSMCDVKLPLRKDVDLTKPIAEQVLSERPARGSSPNG